MVELLVPSCRTRHGVPTVSPMKKVIVVLIVIVGLLAAAVAAVYFAEPVHSLPSFFPGHAHTGNGIRYKKGAIAAVAAVVLWVIAIVVGMAGGGHRSAVR